MCQIKEETNELISSVFDPAKQLSSESLQYSQKNLKALLDRAYTLNKQMQISKNYLQNDVSSKLEHLEKIVDKKIKAKKEKIRELKVSSQTRKFHLYLIYMIVTIFGSYLLTYLFFLGVGYANRVYFKPQIQSLLSQVILKKD